MTRDNISSSKHVGEMFSHGKRYFGVGNNTSQSRSFVSVFVLIMNE